MGGVVVARSAHHRYHFHAIAMPGVLWCPIRSCSVASELDLPALARSSNAPKTAGFVCVLASFALAPPTGVEPVTFGLGSDNGELARASNELQVDETVQVETSRRVQRLHPKAGISSPLVTSLLQASADVSGNLRRAGNANSEVQVSPSGVQLLTVREVAATLRVCTATVYDMIEREELEHVRVSNAIRVVVPKTARD